MDTIISKGIKLDKAIKQAKECTQENEHNGARQVLARLINNKFLSQAYMHVGQLQDLFGFMPLSLCELRRIELDPLLIAELTKQFPQDVDRIESAL